MNTSKKKVWLSVLSLFLCVAMLIGTTFAWFTDSITSGKNKIVAGNLDIEMYWTDDLSSGTWNNVEESGKEAIFGGDLWEPGFIQVRYIKVVNAGDLAFKYTLGVDAVEEPGALADAIDVYCMDDVTANVEGRSAFKEYPNVGTLTSVLKKEGNLDATGVILPAGSANAFDVAVGEKIVAVALKMREDAGNEYQGKDIGDGFTVTAKASQVQYEYDSIDTTYDEFPDFSNPDNITAYVKKGADNKTQAKTVLSDGSSVSATVPAGVLMKAGNTGLTLSVTKISEDGNVSATDSTISRVLDVHIEGVDPANTVPILVTIQNALPKNMNTAAISVSHTETTGVKNMAYKATAADLAAHNDYTFDAAGTLTLALCSFSNITMEVDAANPWDGTADTSWYNSTATSFTLTNMEDLAGLAQLVNAGNDFKGKIVTLGGESNTWYVNRENASTYNAFTPIGQGAGVSAESGNKAFRPFRGTFDGNDHNICGLYRKYTASPAEYNVYQGLFGSVENATIKNINILNSYILSYGAAVGLVATMATGACTFENIRLADNFVSAYNNYLGGVVGCAYDYSGATANITFKNINIDSSNQFAALWKTYDLPCGGILGGAYSNSQVNFTSCDVSCEMNLYNDCCANYQWFAYRYSGMLIGYLRGTADAVKKFVNNNITCSDVTVKYGEWTDLYYCELISLGKGSYNDAHQWKLTRIDKSQVTYDGSGKINGCTAHNHAANNSAAGRCSEDEDNIAVNIPFNQLFGGGQGVKGVSEKTGVTVVNNTGSFELKFKNTDKFLYRVGNMNTVSLGSLFAAKGGTDIRSSAVKLTAKQISGNVSANYTANNADWTQGTIQFSGTGVTNLLLSYYDNTVLSLKLEVIKAMNATSSESAGANDVVLLNDVGFNTVSVKNGYTLHGNGFTMTNTADVSCISFHSNCGYVTLTDGHLDNVRVICPVFSEQLLYQVNAKDYLDNGRYTMSRCAVEALGNSSISNSYISGGRASIFTGDGCGTLVVSNTTVAGGTMANMNLYGGKKVVLRDVTTVMTPQTATADSSKTVYGLGILVESSSLKLNIEGTFKQYNWITKADANSYIDSTLATMVKEAFNKSQFVHSYNGSDYANTGIIYIADWDTTNSKTNLPAYLTDSRSDKQGYEGLDITKSLNGISVAGGVYSVGSAGTLNAANFTAPAYQPTGYNVVSPVFSFDNTANAITKTSDTEPYCTYASGTISVGTKDATKVLDFSSVTVTKDGETLTPTVTLSSNKATVNGKKITFDTSVTDYTVTFAVTLPTAGYNADGTAKGGSTEFSWDIDVHFALLAYDPPEWNEVSTTGSNHIWAVKNPATTDPDYSDATPVFNGIKVKYYDKSGTLQTKDLSSTTTIPTQDSGDTYKVSFDDGSVLRLNTSHDGYSYQLCNNVVYIYKNTARNNRDTTSKAITYTFTDPNGLSTASTVKVTYSFSETDPGVYVKLSDFQNGKYTTCSGEASGTCVVKGTMMTMADGSLKPVEDLKAGDMLLVWDFDKGCYSASPSVFTEHNEEKEYEIVYLTFSDGTEIGICSTHGFFDTDLEKFVYLDKNAAKYIGHSFVKQAENGKWTTVKLTKVTVKKEYTSVYGPVSYGTLNFYNNGMLSLPGNVEGLFNIYQVDADTMKYNAAAKHHDLDTYGRFTYEDFKDILPEEAFYAFGLADLKVAMAKGMIDWDTVKQYAADYVPQM